MTDLAEELADLAIEKSAANFGGTLAGTGIGALLGAGGGALSAYLGANTDEELRPLLKRRLLSGALMGGGLGGIGGSLFDTGAVQAMGRRLGGDSGAAAPAATSAPAGGAPAPAPEEARLVPQGVTIRNAVTKLLAGAGGGSFIGSRAGKIIGERLPKQIALRAGRLRRAFTQPGSWQSLPFSAELHDLISASGIDPAHTEKVLSGLGRSDILKKTFSPFSGARPSQWGSAALKTLHNLTVPPEVKRLAIALEQGANHDDFIRKLYARSGIDLARGAPRNQETQAGKAVASAGKNTQQLVTRQAAAAKALEAAEALPAGPARTAAVAKAKADLKQESGNAAAAKTLSDEAAKTHGTIKTTMDDLGKKPVHEAATMIGSRTPGATELTKSKAPGLARDIAERTLATHPEFQVYRENQVGRPQRFGRLGGVFGGIGGMALMGDDLLQALTAPGRALEGGISQLADPTKE